MPHKLKVVLVFRMRRDGCHSIETLFSSLANVLDDKAEILEYSLGSKWGDFSDILKLWRIRADVYHITGAVHYIALLLPHNKTVVTVHDMNHCLYDLHGTKQWLFKKLWFDLPLRRVRFVTAISEKTKSQLEFHCPGIHSQIRVVENCEPRGYKPVLRDYNEDCPRVLFVGTAPWKNLRRLVDALEGIRCKLVVVGPLDQDMRAHLTRARMDFENYVDLSESELHRQYVECDLLAFVSEREGFGLPILEAQALGRPVITSDVSPMREVAGDGACLVNPLSSAEIRAAFLKVSHDSDYRRRIIERGLENVLHYSVETVAEKYWELYQEVDDRQRDCAVHVRA